MNRDILSLESDTQWRARRWIVPDDARKARVAPAPTLIQIRERCRGANLRGLPEALRHLESADEYPVRSVRAN